MNQFQQRLLLNLNNTRTRYLVIGGQAMRAHGINRPTRDLDLFLSPHRDDASKIISALGQIDRRFEERVQIETLLRPLVRIPINSAQGVEVDLLTSIDGIYFDHAYARGNRLNLDGQTCSVASVNDLIEMKKLCSAKCRADAQNPNMCAENINRAISMASVDEDDIKLLHALLKFNRAEREAP